MPKTLFWTMALCHRFKVAVPSCSKTRLLKCSMLSLLSTGRSQSSRQMQAHAEVIIELSNICAYMSAENILYLTLLLLEWN